MENRSDTFRGAFKAKQLVISAVTGIFGTYDRHNDTMAMIMKVLKPPILLT